MPGSGEDLASFWDRVFKCLRRIMYQGDGEIRKAAALFFYRSNSKVWEPKEMTDVERLALLNTEVRPIVENWSAYESGRELTTLEACYEELRTLVMENGDKVTPLLAELERVSGS